MYNLQEEAYRELVFSNNLDEINRHNSNPARTYDMGLNQFSALTTDEFRQKYLLTSPLFSSTPLVS
ncbi:MAG: hypothetical protein KBC84_08125 [Proteobacteria bacterium]|nr:hypothetical protein [Pseudomonadota bacterium]